MKIKYCNNEIVFSIGKIELNVFKENAICDGDRK